MSGRILSLTEERERRAAARARDVVDSGPDPEQVQAAIRQAIAAIDRLDGAIRVKLDGSDDLRPRKPRRSGIDLLISAVVDVLGRWMRRGAARRERLAK